MFVDQVTIQIQSGRGGNGYIGFYRAKYVPNGGPDGGDGGRGGDVVFIADTSVSSLMDFRYKRRYAAADGENGSGGNRTGKNGADLIVIVPVGTVVRTATADSADSRVLADIVTPGERYVLAKGGRGGRGNQHFATPTRQAPKFAEDGKPGKTRDLILELKMIADAGIIGFPNAGKSTLLSMVTNAKPKIANYQFTTLSPNLGVVRSPAGDFVLADIPGLIEGASQGVGLGHDFLRHIERTKVLVHVVDMTCGVYADDGIGSPVDAVAKINHELAAYNPALLRRPQVIAANKMDLPESAEGLAALQAYAAENGWPVYPISAATNEGLDALIGGVAKILAAYPEDIVFAPDYAAFEEPEDIDARITVAKESDGLFSVEGPGIERMLGYTHMENEKGFAFFQRFLREKGIIAQLEALGIQEGDTVQIYELAFEYYP